MRHWRRSDGWLILIDVRPGTSPAVYWGPGLDAGQGLVGTEFFGEPSSLRNGTWLLHGCIWDIDPVCTICFRHIRLRLRNRASWVRCRLVQSGLRQLSTEPIEAIGYGSIRFIRGLLRGRSLAINIASFHHCRLGSLTGLTACPAAPLLRRILRASTHLMYDGASVR